MKAWAEQFYNSDAWRACREGFLQSKGYLCERCSTPDNPVVAKIAHHKIYLTKENINNPYIALSWDNLEALCQDCHNNATDITKKYTNENDEEITRTDEEYLACLEERGASELEQYAETLSFSSTINTHANLKYREDYDLGDRVTCVNKRWGIKINVRITEVAETYQQNMEEIDITFGESLPALITQIRQITK